MNVQQATDERLELFYQVVEGKQKMHERIKELAQQAEILITKAGAFHNTPQGAYQLQEQHMKKFAELLIKECAQVIKDCEKYGCDKPLEFKVLEHFGVEE